MANLSVPSPGKSILDIFRKKTVFDHLFGIRNFNICFFQKNGSQVAPRAKVAMQKASQIDPLVMMDSPNAEFVCRYFSSNLKMLPYNWHQTCIYGVKTYFLFVQYRKIVTKESEMLHPFFEPCSSCVDVDFFFQKQTISKKRLQKRTTFRSFLTMFVELPQCHFLDRNKNCSPPGVCKRNPLRINRTLTLRRDRANNLHKHFN